MAQVTSQTIANGGGSAVRAALNQQLGALYSASSGPAAPSPTVGGQLWLDTGASPPVLRVRNTANTGWIAVSPETLPANTLWGNPTGAAAAGQGATVTDLKAMLGITQSLGASGWQRHPSGVMEQWVLSPVIASGANQGVTLPATFASAIYGAEVSYVSLGGNAAVGEVYIGQVRALALSAVTIRNLGPANAQFFLRAIGA